MRTTLATIALIGALCLPAATLAQAAVDATLIPDSTYTVTVLSVLDSKHVKVKMDNGVTTTLSAGRPTVDFGKVKKNDQLKLSISKGQVLVYLDLTSH